MSVFMVFRIALKALGRNKLRTALTMLGMIIGVGAVITMVALGDGAQSAIDAQIQSAGTNMIQVSAGNFATGGVRQGDGVFVPYKAVMKEMRGLRFIQQITVSGPSAATTSQTADAIAALMRVRHKIQPGDPDDFMVRTMDETASVRKETTQTMTALLA